MGAIAEAIASYAQPLIDQTDGSIEQLKKAFAIAQVCFNIALLDDQGREKSIGEMRPSLGMDAAEFAEFRRSIIDPMIRRHEEMFPLMHQRTTAKPLPSGRSPRVSAKPAVSGDKNRGIDRYAPCPCRSGEKYKFCCGAKGR